MQIFKNYLKIIYKNKISILSLLAIFAVLLNINNFSTKKDLKQHFAIEIVDKADNEDSKNLIDFLDKKYDVTVEDLTTEEAKDLLFSSMTSYILFIEENNNLSYFAKEENSDYIAINMAINEYLSTKNTLNHFGIENSYDNTVEILEDAANYEILDSTDLTATESYYIYLAYIILTLVLSIVFLAHYSFLKDGVQNRIRISKTKINKFNLSLYVSSIIFITILCIGFSVFELIKNKSDIEQLPVLFLNLIAFAVPIIALAYIVSSLSTTPKNNGAINNIISLVLCFITGIFVPQQFLPEFLLKISSIFPPYWYVKGIKSITKSDYNTLFQVIAIQLLIAIVFILVNSLLSKSKKINYSHSR
ncbi:ABC transporter permease [Peptostreptococcaceae bacterium OttesenSCG-928-C18]|nr:ABC transporter permease [Peptostreptococcaceae bacterium OttesenSCG-928-C18]